MTQIYTLKNARLTFPSLTGRIPLPPEPKRFDFQMKMPPGAAERLRELFYGADYGWLEHRSAAHYIGDKLHYDMESEGFEEPASLPSSVWSGSGFSMGLSSSLTKAPSLELWRSGRGKSTSWNDQMALESFLTAISALHGSPHWTARWKKYSDWTTVISAVRGVTIITSMNRLKGTTALKTSLPQVVRRPLDFHIRTLRSRPLGFTSYANRIRTADAFREVGKALHHDVFREVGRQFSEAVERQHEILMMAALRRGTNKQEPDSGEA